MASIVNKENMSKTSGSGFQFGTDYRGIAGELRKLADAIEDGHVADLSATVYSTVSSEDFQKTGIVLKFAEKTESARFLTPKELQRMAETLGMPIQRMTGKTRALYEYACAALRPKPFSPYGSESFPVDKASSSAV